MWIYFSILYQNPWDWDQDQLSPKNNLHFLRKFKHLQTYEKSKFKHEDRPRLRWVLDTTFQTIVLCWCPGIRRRERKMKEDEVVHLTGWDQFWRGFLQVFKSHREIRNLHRYGCMAGRVWNCILMSRCRRCRWARICQDCFPPWACWK